MRAKNLHWKKSAITVFRFASKLTDTSNLTRSRVRKLSHPESHLSGDSAGGQSYMSCKKRMTKHKIRVS